MTHGSLFSGIGGFDLAAEWMGWENVFHCEWNEFGQRVLKYYWPNAESFNDITKTDFRKYANRIDILTGGFPCQPYSVAGKRKGKEDDRHLWPEMLRSIREIQPSWIVGENVSGIVSWNGGLVFEEVCADLENEGYEVQSVILPACAVNAPHRRDRVWFVAHFVSNGHKRRFNKRKKKGYSTHGNVGKDELTTNTNGRLDTRKEHGQEESGFNTKENKGIGWQNFPTQSPLYYGNDGIPTQLDGITFPKWRNESIKAGGNAIVPQVAYQIFKAIEKCQQQ